ncbi:hypothetical protein DENSPDRAFT_578174 [Dentipellis sp. KUC8613]|nr:hypothetical protein DENSPDRAFT_578174 [Dentipellis sp. KUC8613]
MLPLAIVSFIGGLLLAPFSTRVALMASQQVTGSTFPVVESIIHKALEAYAAVDYVLATHPSRTVQKPSTVIVTTTTTVFVSVTPPASTLKFLFNDGLAGPQTALSESAAIPDDVLFWYRAPKTTETDIDENGFPVYLGTTATPAPRGSAGWAVGVVALAFTLTFGVQIRQTGKAPRKQNDLSPSAEQQPTIHNASAPDTQQQETEQDIHPQVTPALKEKRAPNTMMFDRDLRKWVPRSQWSRGTPIGTPRFGQTSNGFSHLQVTTRSEPPRPHLSLPEVGDSHPAPLRPRSSTGMHGIVEVDDSVWATEKESGQRAQEEKETIDKPASPRPSAEVLPQPSLEEVVQQQDDQHPTEDASPAEDAIIVQIAGPAKDAVQVEDAEVAAPVEDVESVTPAEAAPSDTTLTEDVTLAEDSTSVEGACSEQGQLAPASGTSEEIQSTDGTRSASPEPAQSEAATALHAQAAPPQPLGEQAPPQAPKAEEPITITPPHAIIDPAQPSPLSPATTCSPVRTPTPLPDQTPTPPDTPPRASSINRIPSPAPPCSPSPTMTETSIWDSRWAPKAEKAKVAAEPAPAQRLTNSEQESSAAQTAPSAIDGARPAPATSEQEESPNETSIWDSKYAPKGEKVMEYLKEQERLKQEALKKKEAVSAPVSRSHAILSDAPTGGSLRAALARAGRLRRRRARAWPPRAAHRRHQRVALGRRGQLPQGGGARQRSARTS